MTAGAVSAEAIRPFGLPEHQPHEACSAMCGSLYRRPPANRGATANPTAQRRAAS